MLSIPSLVLPQALQAPWRQFQNDAEHRGVYTSGANGAVLPSLDEELELRRVWSYSADIAIDPDTASIPAVDGDGYVYQLVNADGGNAAYMIRHHSEYIENDCLDINQLPTTVSLAGGATFNNISPVIDDANESIYIVSNQGTVFFMNLDMSPSILPPLQVGGEVRCSPTFDRLTSRLYVVTNINVDADADLEGRLVCINVTDGTQAYSWSPQDITAIEPYFTSDFSAPVSVASVTDSTVPAVSHAYVLALVDDDDDGSYSIVLYAVQQDIATPGQAILDWSYRVETNTIASFSSGTFQFSGLTVRPNINAGGGSIYAEIFLCTRAGDVHLVTDQYSAFDPTETETLPFVVDEEITGSPALSGPYLYVLTSDNIFLLDNRDLTLFRTYTPASGGNLLTSPALDSNSVVYFGSGTMVRAMYYDEREDEFLEWNTMISNGGLVSTPVVGYLIDAEPATEDDPAPPNDDPIFAVYAIESAFSRLFALQENSPPEGGMTAGVADVLNRAYGFRYNNNMGKTPTVFTYLATSVTDRGAPLDPNCDEITSVTLVRDYDLKNLAGNMCFYIDMDNAPESGPVNETMELNDDDYFEYTTDPSNGFMGRELRGGLHSYYVEYTDEYNAMFSTIDSEGVVNGPNMCPELDDTIQSPLTLISNGLEVRAEYNEEGDFTNLNLRILYFDIDEEIPLDKNAVILGDSFDMTYEKSGNEYLTECDWYAVEALIPSPDPFFYFEFSDDTEESNRFTASCTVTYPENGVIYPLKLTEPSVSPQVGDSDQEYTFSVRFFSPFNKGPDEALVYLNDEPVGRTMTLETGTGSPGNAIYSCTVPPGTLPGGLNTYSFYFSNDRDHNPNDNNEFSARMPMGNDKFYGPAISPWPLFRHDRMHTGKSNSPTSVIPDVPEFSFYETGGPIPGSAVVDWDGRIYFGSRDFNFYCLNPDMSLAWSFETGNWIDSSATLGPNGTVIFPSRDNNIYCLNAVDNQTEQANGNRFLWKYSAEGISTSSPVIAPNGNIIVGSSNGILYALSMKGKLNWAYEIGKASINGSPVISTNGDIFFGATNTYFYAIRSDGTLKWKFKAKDVIKSTPLLIENAGLVESIIFTANDYFVYCLSNDGTVNVPPTLKWSFKTGAKFETSSPALGSNNNIYVASDKVYSLNINNGSQQWSYENIENVVLSSPVTDYEDHIVFGGQDGRIYVLNNDNTRTWSYLKESGPLSSSPIILDNGDIIVGSWDGKMYRITQRAANTPPILSNNKVTPAMGNKATTFVYRVNYSDADQDPPELCNLFIDDNPPVKMYLKGGKSYEGTYYYDIAGLDDSKHSYYFEFSDGNWDTAATVRFPVSGVFDNSPIVNDLPSVSCDVLDVMCVSPERGSMDTTFTFSAVYIDPDGGTHPGPLAWIYIDGDDITDRHNLTLTSGSVHDGVYSYTSTGNNLGEGYHSFYFLFQDYSPTVVRYPVTGSITGPLVNESPVLTDGFVTPTEGNTNTRFTYQVKYSDPDGDPINTANVYIDGVPHDMVPSSSSVDGSVMVYETTLSKGNHNYYFVVSDIYDSIGRLPENATEYFEGPFVLQAPILENAKLEPEIGNESTEFFFSVDYQDLEGLPPKMQRLYVNNIPYDMVRISGESYNGTYQAVVKGSDIGIGFDNCYSFHFQNTIDAATRYPDEGCFDGPTVLAAAINIPFWQVRPEIDTLFAINNIGTTPTQVNLVLRTKDGLLKYDGDFTIPARGQRTISLKNLETDIINNYGYGEITWDTGSLLAWGIVYYNYTGYAFPIPFDIPRMSPIYIPYYNFDVFLKMNSAIFLTNQSNVISTGTISFYSSYGQLFSRVSFELEPGIMETVIVGNTDVPSGTEGYAKVEWDQGVLSIFEAVYNTQSNSGYTVHCYPPFESRIEIPNWRKIQGSACASAQVAVPPYDFPSLFPLVSGYEGITDFENTINSYPIQKLSVDETIEHGILDPYNDAILEEVALDADKAPAPGFLPVLSNGGVNPIEGSRTKQFMFHVHYFDQDGDAPTIPNLVLDGIPFRMFLSSGTESNGQYTVTRFDMTEGTHSFYFEFADGVDGLVRYPAVGSFVGPMVQDPTTFCWDTSFYLTNTGTLSEATNVTLTLNNSDGSKSRDLHILQNSFPGSYMKVITLSDEPTVLDGFGSGYISWDGPPLLLFAKVFNPVLDSGYALEFNTPMDETIYIPVWLTYESAGLTTQFFITNKSAVEINPLMTLFDASGKLVHTESIAPIAGNSTAIVDFSHYFGLDLQFGSGYITWDEGELDIYGHVFNEIRNQYYLINFDRPRIQ